MRVALVGRGAVQRQRAQQRVPGRLEDDNSDFVTVNPARSLLFCKDILVSSRPDGGYAAISIVDNIVDEVPEPGMLGLAAFAGGGLLLRRRR